MAENPKLEAAGGIFTRGYIYQRPLSNTTGANVVVIKGEDTNNYSYVDLLDGVSLANTYFSSELSARSIAQRAFAAAADSGLNVGIAFIDAPDANAAGCCNAPRGHVPILA
ncbi:MAG: hypothetical protein AB7M12_11865 [Hyphomonadaceae bacterium]